MRLSAVRRRPATRQPAVAAEVRSQAEVWGPRVLVLMILIWPVSFLINYEAAVTILNFLALALAAAGLRWRGIGLFGISLLCTLDALARNLISTGGLWRWNTVNYWLLLIIVISLPYLLRINDPHTRLLQIFILLLSAMLIISLNVSLGVQDVLNITATFGILIYFARAVDEKGGLYWVGVLCGTVGALGGLIFYILQNDLPYVNPNSFSQFPLTALFAICLALPRAMEIRRGRLWLMLLVVFNVVWVFLSGSRGSMAIAFICVLYMVFVLRSFSWTTAFVVVGVTALFIFSNVMAEQQAYSLQRISRMFDPNYTLAERTSGRTEIAVTGWQIFQEQPLGIGTGSFRSGADYLNIEGGGDSPAHSAWIKTLAENGVQGFILLAAWVVSFLLAGVRTRQREMVLIGILVTVVLSTNFITHEFQGKDLWFLVAGATVFLHQGEFRNYNQPFFGRLRRRAVRTRGETHG